MPGDDLAIIVPMWKRAHRVRPLYDSVRAATPDARLFFVISRGDVDVLQTVTALADDTHDPKLDGHLVLWPAGSQGDYARKINYGYANTVEPFVFTGADDLAFRPGWYEAAREVMDACPHGDATCPCQDGDSCHYDPPNPFLCPRTNIVGCTVCKRIGVVGTVDLCNDRTRTGESSTHSLVRRAYIEEHSGVVDAPNRIYCEKYWHEYVDDELCQTAMSRGAYAHAFDAVVEHLHPNVRKAPMDAVYVQGRSRRYDNERLFNERRHLWS